MSKSKLVFLWILAFMIFIMACLWLLFLIVYGHNLEPKPGLLRVIASFGALTIIPLQLLLILFFNIKDYFSSQVRHERINFKGSFTKVFFVPIFFNLINYIVISSICQGEDCFGLIGIPIVVVVEVIFGLITTGITYAISKNST